MNEEQPQIVHHGPRGYILCTVHGCGKEVPELSRETSYEYAKCQRHRQSISQPDKGDDNMSTATKEARAKAPRKSRNKSETGKVPPAIKWFQELVQKTTDVQEIKAAAKKEKYTDNAINKQLWHLRGMGLLPKAERPTRVPKVRAAKRAARSVKAS